MNLSPTASLLINAARGRLASFFESFCWIQEKSGAIVEGRTMHVYQAKIEAVQKWCKDNCRPCRIIGLKPRRGGSSTFSVAGMYHDLMWNLRRGVIMGGSDFQGANLFAMLKCMADRDRTVPRRATVLDKEARFPNGSVIQRINGSNPNAGLSGGYQYMVITELAKWAQEGVAAAKDVVDGALKCVAYLPGTTIIIESTADGVGNEYHRRYTEGITFEELKAGKEGFVKIFSPWFEFLDYTKDAASEGIQSESDLTTDERDLVAEYKLSLQQVAWMRYAIKELCGGSFDDFKENYPFNDVECFLLSGRKAFSIAGIKAMKDDCYKFPYATGTIDHIRGQKDSAIIWRADTTNNCRVLRWEQPIEGCRYLVVIDPMTGASQVVGEDPDNHSVLVWRAGYHSTEGKWQPPRVVARLIDDLDLWIRDHKYILTWDIDVLEEQVWRLAEYFGHCMIVPEMNMERGMVELLKLRGANIYVRKAWNRREKVETNVLGFSTTGGEAGTRERVIATLAAGIREYAHHDPITGWSADRCEIYDPILLDECETFIIKMSGRSEAMQGKHDDNVLAGSIGLECINSATVYHRPVGRREYFAEEDGKPARRSDYS